MPHNDCAPASNGPGQRRLLGGPTPCRQLAEESEDSRMRGLIAEYWETPARAISILIAVWGIFAAVDKYSSAQIKIYFAEYLRTADFMSRVGSLPGGTKMLFEDVFGERHLSIKCFITSAKISVVLVVTFIFWGEFK